jgi:hypothetical protein
MPKGKVSVPGEDATNDAADAADEQVSAGANAAAETPDQELARLRAENAALQAAAAERDKLPQAVYEPVTPHGQAAMDSSATAGMSVAEVMAAVDAGKLREPVTSYLCRDGYYARRA